MSEFLGSTKEQNNPKLLSGSSSNLVTTTGGKLAPNFIGEQFLRLYLDGETGALLPISQLTEVLNISCSQVMPIPHMHPWIMGVYNWRGEILWLVDLAHLVGITPMYQQALTSANYTVVVLEGAEEDSMENERKAVGLVINQVGNIESCNPDLIKDISSASIDSKLEAFLRGYWCKSDYEMLAVFQLDAIWEAMSQEETNSQF
ncbi:MAG: chemotaxis protein CheW [Xenococcaceae cyanobacterium]